MILVEGKPREIVKYEDGYAFAKLDLQASTASDLPAKNAAITGTIYKVVPGSIAQIIQADEPTFVTLDEDGTWYPEQS